MKISCLPNPLPRQCGFTLMEILVVVVIIGVIVGGAMISIGDPGVDKIREENERLIALVQLTQDEAILQSRDIGIGFWQDGYAFFQPTGAKNEVGELLWQQLEDDILRQRSLPQGMRIQLKLEGTEIIMNAIAIEQPQIMVLSSGEITPFQLILSFDRRYESGFSVDPLGTIELLDSEDL